ncbi:MAG: hypothetical protein ABS999_22340, partial [Pseudomonas atacamensis]|uniref:hypothetical protein n=1 Tax=Pseudomonas atacamensis TaxID=2565368 RepID=UPI003315AA0E
PLSGAERSCQKSRHLRSLHRKHQKALPSSWAFSSRRLSVSTLPCANGNQQAAPSADEYTQPTTEGSAMQPQPLMQQRREVLNALFVRSHAARGEFARLAGLAAPDKKVRFQVKTVGNAYHIVDLVTGKTKAFRFNYQVAVNMAIAFEKQANRVAEGVH